MTLFLLAGCWVAPANSADAIADPSPKKESKLKPFATAAPVEKKTSKPKSTETAVTAATRKENKPKSPIIAPTVEISSPELKVSTPPADVDQLLLHFQYLDKNLNSFRAKFKQSVLMPETGIAQHVEGSVEYLKPNRLRLEHLRPERQTVIADGKTLWIHRLDRDQVIQSNLEDWKKADPVAGRLLDFGNYTALLKAYEVSYDATALDATLKPKEPKQDFHLRLRLAGPAYFPAETELTVGQMKIKTSFEELRFNIPIPEKRFTFAPPDGAEVFRNFKPPIPGGKKP